eukprot:gene25312-36513_t
MPPARAPAPRGTLWDCTGAAPPAGGEAVRRKAMDGPPVEPLAAWHPADPTCAT